MLLKAEWSTKSAFSSDMAEFKHKMFGLCWHLATFCSAWTAVQIKGLVLYAACKDHLQSPFHMDKCHLSHTHRSLPLRMHKLWFKTELSLMRALFYGNVIFWVLFHIMLLWNMYEHVSQSKSMCTKETAV